MPVSLAPVRGFRGDVLTSGEDVGVTSLDEAVDDAAIGVVAKQSREFRDGDRGRGALMLGVKALKVRHNSPEGRPLVVPRNALVGEHNGLALLFCHHAHHHTPLNPAPLPIFGSLVEASAA
jgi:hypothetical protein